MKLMKSMKKIFCFMSVVFSLIILSGCFGKPEVRFGLEEKDGKLSEIVEFIPAKREVYVQYTQPNKFKANSVEVEIYLGDRIIAGGSNIVEEGSKSVIVPVMIPKPGMYFLVVRINDEVKYEEEISVVE
jgi:hypothetical protein